MALISLLLLVALGVLGIASWLKAKRRAATGNLGALESAESLVGAFGLVWGIVSLLQVLPMLSAFSSAPLLVLIAIASVAVELAISLLLALPLVQKGLGASAAADTLANLANKLTPFKVALGFACLALAAISLLGMLGIHV